jgi:signal transduction histidine kinase
MKKTRWLLLVLVLAIAGMAGIFSWQTREFKQDISKITSLWERQNITRDLMFSLEKYRRASSSFRRIGDGAMAQVKTSLKNEIDQGVARLESLDTTPEQSELGVNLTRQLADFMVLSAKLEPWLFSKDVFLKPEAVAAHDSMVATLKKMREHDVARLTKAQGEALSSKSRLNTFHMALGVGVIVVIALFLMGVFGAYIRPIAKLMARVREIREGKLRRANPSNLGGVHGEIEKALDELAMLADSQKRERHQFVTAVASDLRSPLIPLQTSASLLASMDDRLSPEQRSDTAEVIRRSVMRLTRTLDDLTDTVNVETGTVHLDEKIVDVRELMSRVSTLWNGPGSIHEIRISAPALPVWAYVDPVRFERVLINLITKITQFCPQGGRVDMSLSKPNKKGIGAEIVIHEGSGPRGELPRPSGPEQELLRHWISENGFGLGLAQRVVEAHGGQISAAGVAGTSVIFTVRIPEERIASSLQSQAQPQSGQGVQSGQAGSKNQFASASSSQAKIGKTFRSVFKDS